MTSDTGPIYELHELHNDIFGNFIVGSFKNSMRLRGKRGVQEANGKSTA